MVEWKWETPSGALLIRIEFLDGFDHTTHTRPIEIQYLGTAEKESNVDSIICIRMNGTAPLFLCTHYDRAALNAFFLSFFLSLFPCLSLQKTKTIANGAIQWKVLCARQRQSEYLANGRVKQRPQQQQQRSNCALLKIIDVSRLSAVARDRCQHIKTFRHVLWLSCFYWALIWRIKHIITRLI